METINTFTVGPFTFCDRYDLDAVLPPLVRVQALAETIRSIPLAPHAAARLETELMYRSVAGTARVEGNRFSEEDVARRDRGENPPGSVASGEREAREIDNLLAAYKRLGQAVHGPLVVSEDFIKSLHAEVSAGLDGNGNTPGQYRNGPVKVGDAAHGGIWTPPKRLDDIRQLMGHLAQWANSDALLRLPPWIRAALLHYHFCLIHPFADGNGRTARLLEAWLLHGESRSFVAASMANSYARHVDDYYQTFSATRKAKEDCTAFVLFALGVAEEALAESREKIVAALRLLVLKDYYAELLKEKQLSRRQHELLLILLERPAPFSLDDLYMQPVFRALYGAKCESTVRGDLRKLTGLGLLRREDRNYVLNLGMPEGR